jgi:hypothetical protein
VQCAWSASWCLANVPAARGALVSQLQDLCSAVNSTGTTNAALQADVNALLCMCLVASGESGRAVEHSTRALLACPAEGQDRLWAWRIQAATLTTTTNSSDVVSAMGHVGSYPVHFQAAAWLGLTQCSSSQAAQHAALARCLHAAAGKPDLAARYHAEWAEWLLKSDSAMVWRSAACDALAYAFKLLITLDCPSTRPYAEAMAFKSHANSSQMDSSGVAVGAESIGSNSGKFDLKLGVLELELLVRVSLLRALAAEDQAEDLDWLHAAQHYAVRMLRTCFLAPCTSDTADTVVPVTADIKLPELPHEWLTFQLTDRLISLLDKAKESPSLIALTHGTVLQYDRTQQCLDLLVEKLQRHGCMLECVPLRWLQYVCTRQLKGVADASVFLMEASLLLKQLGSVEAASQCLVAAGMLPLAGHLLLIVLCRGFSSIGALAFVQRSAATARRMARCRRTPWCH